MRIILKHKGGRGKSRGYISSVKFNSRCHIYLTYEKSKEIIKDVQKVLLKHYDLVYVGSGGRASSKLLLPEVTIPPQRRARGSVGRGLRLRERYQSDEEYRRKMNQYKRQWEIKNKERVNLMERRRRRILSEFRNKHCIDCNKLLNYRTQGELCRVCRGKKGIR